MRLAPHRLAMAVVAILAVTTYAWTTATSVEVTHAVPQYEPYPRLADAFLHGRLSLDVRVPPGLLRLRDPYDPVQNAGYRRCCGFKPDSLHDLSLHDGKVYPYWGPVPVLAFLPAALFGGHLEQGWVVFAFTVAAFLLAVAVLRELLRFAGPRRRRPWMEVAAVAALAWTGVMLYNLRRPAQYEVALSGALAFAMLGLLLVLRAMEARRRGRLLVGASTAFALAFGCRPSVGLLGLLVLVPLLQGTPARSWRTRVRILVREWRVFVPFALALALSGAYNLARFGSPLEFGLHDLLSGVDLAQHPLAQPGYLLPGLWYYVLAPPLLRLHFPFVVLPPPPYFWGATPSTYYQSELVGGMAAYAPVVLLGLLVPLIRPRRPLRRMLALLIALGAVLLLFDAFYVYTAVMRYEADFIVLFVLAGLTAWLVLGSDPTRRSRLVRRAGWVLVAISIVCGMAISIRGQGSSLLRSRPAAFRRLESIFAPIPTVASAIVGRPLITAINDQSVQRPRYDELWISRTGFILGNTPMTLEIASPGARTATLVGELTRGPTLTPGASAAMEVTMGPRLVAEVPVDRSFAVPVPLGLGLNRVTLSLIAHPRPNTSVVGDHLSNVADLRVR